MTDVSLPDKHYSTDQTEVVSLWSQNLVEETNALVEACSENESDRQAMEKSLQTLILQMGSKDASTDERLAYCLSSLSKLSEVFGLRFKRHQDPWYISQVIKCKACAISLLPEEHTERSEQLYDLGASYFSLFQCNGNPEEITESIEYMGQVASLTPEDHPGLIHRLASLAASYSTRFQYFGQLKDLGHAIDLNNRATILARSDDVSMKDLASAYMNRFQELGEVDIIDQSIEYHTRALSLVSDNYSNKLTMITNLSISYKRRFDNIGDVDDIRKAIHYQNQAVLATPPDHLDHPLRLTLLGQFYLDLSQRISQPDDVDLAITHLQQAVLSTAKTHFELPSRMSTLCLAHRLRFQQCGQLLDLGTSTERAIQAVSITSIDDPRLPSFLNNLGTNHLIQFRHAGDPEELSRAIKYLTQAVSLTPEDQQDYRRLHNLGNAFSDKFEHYGQIEDIDKAIELIHQGLPLIPQGHSDIPIQLNNLGKSHLIRFERLNQAEDNNKAIDLFNQSVKLTAPSSPDLPGQLNNLGTSYLARFQRLGRQEDIDKAIEYLVQGAELIQKNQPDLPLVLNQLGISYRIRFSCANNIDDINKAISCLKRAILLTPEGSRNVPMLLNSLSTTHLIRFKELGGNEDIENTIELFSKVLSLTPDGHPELPGFLLNLGQAYFSRFKRFGDHQARLSSLQYFQRSAESIEGHPRFRLDAAWMWARAASFHSVLDSLKGYNRAMDIIPQLVWLGASISQRYDDVRMTGNLAVEAAANAIQAGEYRLAVEWLEQGRSIVWNQILQLRTPLDQLHAANPLLAEKITQVASKLNSTGYQTLEQTAQEHRRTALEYERLISEVRQLPGFGDFLRPKKFFELMRVARYGPVVMINVHASHCDALIILPEQQGIMHVPLTKLSYPKVLGIRAYLDRSLQSHNVRDRGVVRRPMADETEQESDSLKDIFIALWIDIVQPVLSALGYLKRPTGGKLPHITWCTTGALTFLPLHAAGFYEEPCERTFDFVVSSYTPTISALLTSESVDGGSQHSGVLAVGQELSPGQSRLPGTTQELTYIKKHVEPLTHYTQLDGDSGTVLNILAAMESHSWVHMACHASQQVGDPTESGFFLQDGILSIATITQKYFKNKGLAFLSACQTATGDTARPDEAVHLASGMLMAGYPSVIATMWSIGDDDAPLVADWVYSAVIGNGKMDCSRAAEALHTATAHLREKVGETAFVKWVPYIHIGVAM